METLQPALARRAVNDNWLATFRALIADVGGQWMDFGGVHAFRSPGVPATFANGCLVVESAGGEDLRSAVDWVREVAMPFSVRIDTATGDDLPSAALACGLVRAAWTMPGMILEPIPASPAASDGVRTVKVDDTNHTDFIQALVDQGLARPFAEAVFGGAVLAQDDVAFFVAYLDGAVAGESV